MVDIGTAVT